MGRKRSDPSPLLPEVLTVATARSSQSHQKRVQQIATEAAEKIAAESPFEEDVLVVVEELPPGEAAPRTQRARSGESAVLGVVVHNQQVIADGISGWIEMTSAQFAARSEAIKAFGTLFDARRLTQETFRLAEELLASQKDFVLKVVEVVAPPRAA